MQSSPHLLRVALDLIRDAVVTTDSSGRVLALNRAAETLTGWSSEDATGHPIERVVDVRFRETDSGETAVPHPAYAALKDGQRATVVGGGNGSGPLLLIGKTGSRIAAHVAASPVLDEEGKTTGCIVIFHNMQETLEVAERFAYQSLHDTLTGLPNRVLLVDRIEQAARLADRYNELMAVMFVDLDLFTIIRTTYGPGVADELLRAVAGRLSEALRESDSVSRLGRDEFVVVIPGVSSAVNIEAVAAKLILAVAQPFQIGEAAIRTSCSIGISVYPQDASDTATLMRLADRAMYRAKQSGRGRHLFVNREAATSGN
jgi:diguanylate cyclase (GGDEF)-like protein